MSRVHLPGIVWNRLHGNIKRDRPTVVVGRHGNDSKADTYSHNAKSQQDCSSWLMRGSGGFPKVSVSNSR